MMIVEPVSSLLRFCFAVGLFLASVLAQSPNQDCPESYGYFVDQDRPIQLDGAWFENLRLPTPGDLHGLTDRIGDYRSVQYRSNNPNTEGSGTQTFLSGPASGVAPDYRWSPMGHTYLTRVDTGGNFPEFHAESAGGAKNLGIGSTAPLTGDVANERMEFTYDSSYGSGASQRDHYRAEGSFSTLIHWTGLTPNYIEIRHVDGSIARFEETTTDVWRMKNVVDEFDNQTVFTFSNHQLQRIDYPNGLSEHWNWTPSNPGIPAGHTAIEVSYTGGTVEGGHSSLSWGMLFETPSSPPLGSGPFNGDRLVAIYYPKTELLTDEPSSGGLHDLQNNLQDRHRVLTFTYGGTYAFDNEITKVEQGLATSIFDTVSSKKAIEEVRYSQASGKTRATHLINSLHGGTSTILFTSETENSVTYDVVETTDPRGTVTRRRIDSAQRPLTVTITPSAAGKPREQDQGSNGGLGITNLAEPATVVWQYTYGPCSCFKPATVTSPSGRVTSYTWDTNTGMILSKTVNNPSTELGEPVTLTYHWGWEIWDPALNVQVAPKLVSMQGPYGTWTMDHNYTVRADANHGGKLSNSTITTPSITLEGATSSEVLTVSTFYDAKGRVDRVEDPHGVETKFTYFTPVAVGAGRLETETIRELNQTSETVVTSYTWDDWGKLTSMTENSSASGSNVSTTNFLYDAELRLLKGWASVDLANQQSTQTIDSIFHHDRWGHVAVELRTNKDSSGGKIAGSGRDYIRNEFHYLGDRIMEAYLDRQPLDEAASSTVYAGSGAQMLYYLYTYEADGTPKDVVLPSGAVRRYVYDGYGTLYKSEILDGSLQNPVLDSKYFINSELEVVEIFRGDASLKLLSKVTRDPATGVVTQVEMPGVPQTVQGYSGTTAGAITAIGRNRRGRAISYTSGDGSTTLGHNEYLIDELGRTRREKETVFNDPSDPSNSAVLETIYEYSGLRLMKVTSPGNRIVNFDYDALGRFANSFDNQTPSANQSIYTYHSGTQRVAKLREEVYEETLGQSGVRAFETEYDYDQLGRLREAREIGSSTNNVKAFTYFTNGATEAYVDPISKREEYIPDPLGRLHSRAKVGSSSNIANLTTYIDHDGGTGQTRVDRHDGRLRLTKIYRDHADRVFIHMNPGASTVPTAVSPNQPFSTFVIYDAASRIDEIHDAVGLKIEHFFDGADRLIQRQVADLTAAPQVAQIYSATREVYNRNAIGQLLSAGTFGGPIGTSMAWYNANGFATDSLDRTHRESYLYGGFGATTPNMIESTFASADFRGSLTYSSGMKVGYTGDVLGRISRIDSDRSGMGGGGPGNRVLAEYGHMGSAVSYRKTHWASGGSSYATTTREFDVFGRLSKIDDTLASKIIQQFEYGYDAAGNLVKEKYLKADAAQLTGPNISLGDRFVYDDFNRLSEAWLGVDTMGSMTNPAPPDGTVNFVQKLTYGLDAANNRTSVATTQGGSTTTETYSTQDTGETQGASNRYDQVGANTDLIYDDRGNLVFDGTFRYYYDFKNRLTEVYAVAIDGAAEQAALGKSPAGFSSQSTYQVYAATSLSDLGPIEDARKQIWKQAGTDLQKLMNNHLRLMRQGKLSADIVSGDQQVKSSGTKTLSGGTMTLSQGGLQDLDLVLVALYGYDVVDRRIIRFVAGEATYLSAYDGWQEVEEMVSYTPNGGATVNVPYRQFVWGARLNELVSFMQSDGVNWSEYFVTSDGHDSVSRLFDSQGQVVEAMDYDANGRASVFTNVSYDQNGSWAGGALHGALSSVGNPYQWKGHRTDPETGFVYMRHRYYSTGLGRFITLDPIGVWGDEMSLGNGYTYGANSPKVYSDPFGLDCCDALRKKVQSLTAKVAAAQTAIQGQQAAVNALESTIANLNASIARAQRNLSRNIGTNGKPWKENDPRRMHHKAELARKFGDLRRAQKALNAADKALKAGKRKLKKLKKELAVAVAELAACEAAQKACKKSGGVLSKVGGAAKWGGRCCKVLLPISFAFAWYNDGFGEACNDAVWPVSELWK